MAAQNILLPFYLPIPISKNPVRPPPSPHYFFFFFYLIHTKFYTISDPTYFEIHGSRNPNFFLLRISWFKHTPLRAVPAYNNNHCSWCHNCTPCRILFTTIKYYYGRVDCYWLPGSAERGSRHNPSRLQLNAATHNDAYKNIYTYRCNQLVRDFTYTRLARMEKQWQTIHFRRYHRSFEKHFFIYNCRTDCTPESIVQEPEEYCFR